MFIRSAVVCVVLSFASAVFATAPRVFVASTGTDTGGCSRSAPCRNFAYAITQVSPGGELVALDTAGYGPVTITFAVNLYAAPGQVASITATAMMGNDITINAGIDDAVVIRGLFLNSSGSLSGIAFNSGRTLEVQDTVFTNFVSNASLDVERTTAFDSTSVYVENCSFLNSIIGIYARSAAQDNVLRLSVRNSRFEHLNSQAILLGDNARAAITDSSFLGDGYGVMVAPQEALMPADANVERCTFHDSSTALWAGSLGGTSPAILRVAYSMITDNTNSAAVFAGGQILGRVDGTGPTNTVEGNDNTNTLPGSYAAK